ncbi:MULTISPECIES: hypothetical protein [Spirulina sp. CCY15215]|uniref:hypothetical protein n=1 Tax=Spirulina sp. CCY15215 TaxID=2767591 RepID=UPI001951C78B|nr:hypothetical protein [Spirulina major]
MVRKVLNSIFNPENGEDLRSPDESERERLQERERAERTCFAGVARSPQRNGKSKQLRKQN